MAEDEEGTSGGGWQAAAGSNCLSADGRRSGFDARFAASSPCSSRRFLPSTEHRHSVRAKIACGLASRVSHTLSSIDITQSELSITVIRQHISTFVHLRLLM